MENNKEKIFQTYKSGLVAKRVKPEKFKALNKTMKKWLPFLRRKNVLVSGPMLKEKVLEFADEISIEGFQVSEG